MASPPLLSDQHLDIPSQQLGSLIAEQSFRAGIDQPDHSLLVDDHDPVRRGLDKHAYIALLIHDAFDRRIEQRDEK
jgi:hypothetical protein